MNRDTVVDHMGGLLLRLGGGRAKGRELTFQSFPAQFETVL